MTICCCTENAQVLVWARRPLGALTQTILPVRPGRRPAQQTMVCHQPCRAGGEIG